MNSLALDGVDFWPVDILPDAFVAPAGTVAIYLASHGFTTETADAPGSTYFEPRLLAGFVFGRDALGSDRPGGRVALTLGEIELENGDGFYDDLIPDYAIDGRRVVVRAGSSAHPTRATYSSFSTVYDGTAEDWRPERDTLRLRLRGREFRLDLPLNQSTYGGTGGVDGGADLEDKPKPRLYGFCFNVAPVFLGLIDLGFGVLPTFQVNDGAIDDVTAVRERGLVRTKVSGVAPGLGQYVVLAATGMFQLGFDPSGPITCDVRGDKAGGIYRASTADIIGRLFADPAGYTTAEIDAAALAKLNWQAPAEVGVYRGAEPATIRQVLDELAGGVGAVIGETRSGQMQATRLEAPASTAQFALDEADIIELEELPRPRWASPPPQLIRVEYGRNWSHSTDIAAGATEAERKALLQPLRNGSYFSSAVAVSYLLSRTLDVPALFASEADAIAEAARLADFLRPGRRLLRIVTDRYRGQVELGMTGLVSHSELRLSTGLSVVIVKWSERPGDGELELYLWG